MKNMPTDRPPCKATPRTCSFFNCRLSVSCKYDTLLMQANLKLVLRCMKIMKSPLILIWVGFLGVRFEVGGITRPVPPPPV